MDNKKKLFILISVVLVALVVVVALALGPGSDTKRVQKSLCEHSWDYSGYSGGNYIWLSVSFKQDGKYSLSYIVGSSNGIEHGSYKISKGSVTCTPNTGGYWNNTYFEYTYDKNTGTLTLFYRGNKLK